MNDARFDVLHGDSNRDTSEMKLLIDSVRKT